MDFNPGTTLIAAAVFDLTDPANPTGPRLPGKFQGKGVWLSSNPKDKLIDQEDVPETGKSTARWDGTANDGTPTSTDESVYTCTVDGDLGIGQFVVAVVSGKAKWTNRVEIAADGGHIDMSEAVVASALQAAEHRAAAGPIETPPPPAPEAGSEQPQPPPAPPSSDDLPPAA